MTNTTYQLDNFALTLPITQKASKTAQEFANQQPNPEKAEQVRLNTLAVWVVNDYLQMMDIPTNLEVSDSWNRVMRYCADVADLEVPSVGRLECRPIPLHQEICSVPPETWEERVGYVVVQIDESLQEARLMGFVPSVATEELPLSQLQPLEALIEHFGQLSFVKSVVTVDNPRTQKQLANLSQWFAGIFEAGWQTIDSLWNDSELRPAYAFRNRSADTIERNASQQSAPTTMAKVIRLGMNFPSQPLLLIVEITPEVNQQAGIVLRLVPTGEQKYIPQGVQFAVLDGSGALFLESQARKSDDYMQLDFRGESKEQFSVKVALNDVSILEHFII
ncbi:hypothetical protein NIES4074_48950 [Cylindrospermum sp. NIES-4074]|nr:hypothetical protein NIES4074_48950 [Cylindrospermum sp. NIES-4074]